MRVRGQLLLIFGLLFMVLAVLVFLLFRERPVILFASEVVLILLLAAFYFLLMRITRPLEQIVLGLDSLKDQDFSGYMRPTGSKEINLLVEVYNKMLDNIRKERLFQQEQHFFLQNLIEALPVGMIILDFDDQLKEYNPAAGEILGIKEEDRGRKLTDTSLLLGSEILSQEIRRPQTYRISPTRYLRVYVDRFRNRGFYQKFVILEEAGEEILKVEKQSYGKVIRMMAHEVKNSVGAINSILETLATAAELPAAERAEYLQIVIDRNTRLNLFMENFARVVRLPLPGKQVFSLSETVRSVHHLMKLRFQHRPVEFNCVLPPEPVMVTGSQEQLEQALINIVLNAFEAIDDEGRVEIRLSQDSLTVTDTGCGISEEAEAGLFTPFFSTKPTGQGVGLTMVREILHNHGWRFELGVGDGVTVFVIRFN
ncbi:MAG: PAS domain-containing protein [Leadbetterella sp.]|nr:PAS domain-containing protein [Leadbetterella sp.]